MCQGDLCVAAGDGYSVADVRCPAACSGFGAPEQAGHHVLATIRRGAFVRRVNGQDVLLDSTMGYLAAPGTVAQFAHPVAGGDQCTAIRLSPDLLAAIAGGDPHFSVQAVPVDAAAELALRRIVSLARRPDPDRALAELVVRAVAALLARRLPGRVGSGLPRTAAEHRRLAELARAAMLADPGVGLIELSRRVGCSPHHLSRVFVTQTGSTLSRYRSRLRVSLALHRLGDGERDLSAMAAELGFADHAHLARTIRAHTGCTPSACRDLFRSACCSAATRSTGS